MSGGYIPGDRSYRVDENMTVIPLIQISETCQHDLAFSLFTPLDMQCLTGQSSAFRLYKWQENMMNAFIRQYVENKFLSLLQKDRPMRPA
jgi:hypothetical protein